MTNREHKTAYTSHIELYQEIKTFVKEKLRDEKDSETKVKTTDRLPTPTFSSSLERVKNEYEAAKGVGWGKEYCQEILTFTSAGIQYYKRRAENIASHLFATLAPTPNIVKNGTNK